MTKCKYLSCRERHYFVAVKECIDRGMQVEVCS